MHRARRRETTCGLRRVPPDRCHQRTRAGSQRRGRRCIGLPLLRLRHLERLARSEQSRRIRSTMSPAVLDALESRADQHGLVIIDRYGSAGRSLLHRLPETRRRTTTLSLHPTWGDHGAEQVISIGESSDRVLGKHDWRTAVLTAERRHQMLRKHRARRRYPGGRAALAGLFAVLIEAMGVTGVTYRPRVLLPEPHQSVRCAERWRDRGKGTAG